MSNEGRPDQIRDEDAEEQVAGEEKPENSSELQSSNLAPNLDMNRVENSPGPLTPHVLIQWLPKELVFTSFDAFDSNLYLGTDQGDLLHYFEMEPGNYMLVSQTKVDGEKNDTVESIKALSLIEIAIVQCPGTLHFFLLPEFAPVPNMESVRGVSDFEILRYSSTTNSYKVRLFSSEGVRNASISSKKVSVSDFVYSGPVKRARTHHKSMMASDGTNYQLIDLKTGSELPLFHVSETTANLKPVIASYREGEFLLACGSSADEGAMGLVVNCQGDITQGTVAFEKFPLDIVVDLPFIIVNNGTYGIPIYRIEHNSEPKMEQRFWSSEGAMLRLVKCSRSFPIKNSAQQSQILEMLRLVPLSSGNHQFRIDQERNFILSEYEEVTSLVLFSAAGIYLLSKQSAILQFPDYSETTMENIGAFLEAIQESGHFSKFQRLEVEFLQILHLLLRTLHSPVIDDNVVSQWCTHSSEVDVRIFLHLCDIKIFGDPWIPNGLAGFIAETRLLKLKNNFTNYLELMGRFRSKLRDQNFDGLKDRDNIFRSIDVAVVQYCVESDARVDIGGCEQSSYSDMLLALRTKEKRYESVIYDICYRLEDYIECLKILREQGSYLKMSKFILDNLSRLEHCDGYKEEDLLADIIFLTEMSSSSAKWDEVKEDIKKILKETGLDVKDLVAVSESSATKVNLLEHLGTSDIDDKQFMIENYLSSIKNLMEVENLWDFFAQISSTYTQDLDYLKPSLKTYLEIKIKENPNCNNLQAVCEKLRTLVYEGENELVFAAVLKKIETFDIAQLLSLYLVRDVDKLTVFGDNVLERSMDFNDFETINEIVNEKEVARILKYYLGLKSKRDSLKLSEALLTKHLSTIKSNEQLLEIMDLIPSDYEIVTIIHALTPLLARFDNICAQQDLHKALLKQEIRKITRVLEGVGIQDNLQE
ncbi:LADA_0B08570g1_1 [Lachancea dasiensis]|uniref:LADA_0B08570g1_1 n=1 Tax=Lachancea dasiensis TaxID=1072105 RepID=A0A1G4IUI7_9SACH|nr:LADA_0B08570g1_1 [Lachancea dasiensis]